jgi:acetolactate synthase-1/2/3 large subunit
MNVKELQRESELRQEQKISEKLTGGQAVVRSLIAESVEIVFGLPGVQNDWLYNAFFDYQQEIKIIHTRHEQGAGYMALGYHLASGKIGVFNVVPGPGFLNSSAALATAYGLNARVLCLVGQIPSKTQGKGWGVLHEIPDQMGILRSLTKWADRILSPAIAPTKISQAFQQLRNGRPRPVGLEIAMDVLEKEEEIDLYYPPSLQNKTIVPDEVVEAAAILLATAVNPLIFVGSGAMDAGEEVKQLAENLQAPVFSYRTGKGILSSRHYLSQQLQSAHSLWKEADVVVSIGSHIREPLLKWGHDPQLKLISINIDPSDHDRILPSSVSITADACVALKKILLQLKKHKLERPSRQEQMLQLKKDWLRDTAFLQPQTALLQVIREELPDDGILVDELTQVGFASRMLWPSYLPRTYLSTGYMGNLGWGFPTALGAKVAKPNVPVIAITGDGGFMFNVQELATAVQHKIAVIILLFNNNAFGNVQSMQEKLYGNRVIASDLHNPDFVAMARAYGANAVRADSPEALRIELRGAMKRELPTLIEIPIAKDIPSTDDFKNLKKIR